MKSTEVAEIAAWMVSEQQRLKTLHQDHAVWEIRKRFGKDAVTTNDAGNDVIPTPVLNAFRKLTPALVWSRGERCWRAREKGDLPGRQQH